MLRLSHTSNQTRRNIFSCISDVNNTLSLKTKTKTLTRKTKTRPSKNIYVAVIQYLNSDM